MLSTRLNRMVGTVNPYHAPKPKQTWGELFKTIAYWAFPPTALWGLTQLLVNRFAGSAVSNEILPAQNVAKHKQQAHQRFLKFIKMLSKVMGKENNSYTVQKWQVATHDKAFLSTYEFRWHNHTRVRPHIIYFLDRDQACEKIFDQMIEDALECGANVTVFNYRGVALSTKKSTEMNDLTIDGIAQVQRILDRHVNPENIFLKGKGLGATVATGVAKHFHDREKKVYLYSADAPSSQTNYFVGKIRSNGQAGHGTSLWRKILGWVVKPFIQIKLSLTKWEKNIVSDYQSLPGSHKEYTLVRTRKSLRTPTRLDDPDTTHYASLHAALKPERQLLKMQMEYAKEQIKAIPAESTTHKELQQSIRRIDKAKEKLKARKMEPQQDDVNGHTEDPSGLISQYKDYSAETYFQHFIWRASKHQHETDIVLKQHKVIQT